MRSSLSRLRAHVALSLLALLPASTARGAQTPSDAGALKPDPAPPGFCQMVLPAFDIQTDVSKSYLDQLARQVNSAEQRMYQLFNFKVGFLKGNDRSARLGKYNVPGDTLSKWGFKPWIEIKVFKKYEDYVDQYYRESDRLDSLVNKTALKEETPEQRAVRRFTEGVPNAYYMRISDYDKKYMLRRIHAYMGPRTPDEVESDVLHEMGHLFLETFLFEFAGAPKKGQEAEKRGTPAWIGEGVAQLFEINWSSSRQSQKLKLRHNAMIHEAVRAGDSYPFDQFINVTNAHNLLAVASDHLKATINYIQSYSVMMYMVEKDWPRYLNFLENLRANNLAALRKNSRRVSELYSIQDKSFRDAFGIPLLDLEKYWTKHVTETMERALRMKPAAYYWCGEYHLMKKAYDKAAELYRKAIAGAPMSGEGYLGLGRVALLKSDIPTALENLTKATQLSPGEEEAFYYLGQAQAAAGKPKEAIASLEQAIKLYPLYNEALAELGEVCFQLREFKRAMESYEQAFQIQRANPWYLFAKGRAGFFAKEYGEAQRNFAIFNQVFPRKADGPLWYGLSAWRLGDKEFALTKLEEAAKLEPRNGLARKALEMARKGETLTFEAEDLGRAGEVAAEGKKDQAPKPVAHPPRKVAEEE